MKRGMLILLLFVSFFSQAQSLKDALFSGKLKNQPGTTIHKGDDLSTKMDTVRKVEPESTNQNQTLNIKGDSSSKSISSRGDTLNATSSGIQNNIPASSADVSNTETSNATKEIAALPKDNNLIWKKFVDSSNTTLKTEVLSSKKIKKGTYYILVTYAIDITGQVNVSDVAVTPDNAYLQQQIKERLSIDTPQLNPVLSDNGKPRKVIKKYSFTLSKS